VFKLQETPCRLVYMNRGVESRVTLTCICAADGSTSDIFLLKIKTNYFCLITQMTLRGISLQILIYCLKFGFSRTDLRNFIDWY
jgi:hypothetical protein